MFGSPYTHQTPKGPQQGRISSQMYPEGHAIASGVTTSSPSRTHKFGKREQYVFSLAFKDGKTLELRATKPEDFIEWINNIVGARGLAYNEAKSCWVEKATTSPLGKMKTETQSLSQAQTAQTQVETKETDQKRENLQRRKSDPKRQSVFVPVLPQVDGQKRKAENSSKVDKNENMKESGSIGETGHASSSSSPPLTPSTTSNRLAPVKKSFSSTLASKSSSPTTLHTASQHISSSPVEAKSTAEFAPTPPQFTNSSSLSIATTPTFIELQHTDGYVKTPTFESTSLGATQNTENPLIAKRMSQSPLASTRTKEGSTISTASCAREPRDSQMTDYWVSKEENWGGNDGTSSPLNDILMRAQRLRLSKST